MIQKKVKEENRGRFGIRLGEEEGIDRGRKKGLGERYWRIGGIWF